MAGAGRRSVWNRKERLRDYASSQDSESMAARCACNTVMGERPGALSGKRDVCLLAYMDFAESHAFPAKLFLGDACAKQFICSWRTKQKD